MSLPEYELYDNLLSSKDTKHNRGRNYVHRHMQISRQVYDLYKEDFYKNYPFEKVKGFTNPYTRTTVQTWHDYELYGHCFVLMHRVEDHMSSVDESLKSENLQLKTDLKIAQHELSDTKKQNKKRFAFLILTCFLCVILTALLFSRPSAAEYSRLQSELSFAQSETERLSSVVSEAEETIARQQDLLSEVSSKLNSHSSLEGHQIENTPKSHVSDYRSPVQSQHTNETSSGYIGNKKTKKFHKPTCSYLPDVSNRANFSTRNIAISSGYDPCAHCDP